MRGLLDPASKRPLALVRNGVAPVQKRVWVVQKTLGRPLLPGGPKESKRPFAPSPNRFWRLSLFGQFPRSTASQVYVEKIDVLFLSLTVGPFIEERRNYENKGGKFLCYLQLELSLENPTSLNKAVSLFFRCDNSIWSLPSFLPLAITAFRGPEGSFSLAIIAFGAFQFIVSKDEYCLGKMEFKESRLLI